MLAPERSEHPGHSFDAKMLKERVRGAEDPSATSMLVAVSNATVAGQGPARATALF